jgi:hypothetical protein
MLSGSLLAAAASITKISRKYLRYYMDNQAFDDRNRTIVQIILYIEYTSKKCAT